jgi:ABC transporter substrate binding protein (PQQ-dependent alcohol dehydrogenase system)
MMTGQSGLLGLLLGVCFFASAAAQAPGSMTLGYLSVADDPRYLAVETYANIVLRPAIDPFDGARAGLRAGRVLGRALKLKFALERAQGRTAAELLAGLERLMTDHGARVFLVDAPGEMVAELARRTRGRDLLLLNVSALDEELRREWCQPHLLHVAPSRDMLTDALAQYAVFKKWRDILLLQGPETEDGLLARSFARSARRFGARIVETRNFVPTNDPRQREQNNIVLLTTGTDYDAVFVADARGEFGRYFPYQIALPRPVIGSVGLTASAWHWAWERHGAPQLNQRFQRIAERPMTAPDWAAWAAVRIVLEAVSRSRSTEVETLRATLLDQGITLDLYKGNPGSFRPWDNQLRQPILLATHDAVIERAPVTGFLHRTNDLDTLGADEPETQCRF